MTKMAAGGRRLAVQIVVSIVATGTAALVVPQVLAAFSYGRTAPAAPSAIMAPVSAPADFEAAFVWPVQTPPAEPEAAPVRMAALLPAAVPVPMRAPRNLQASHRVRTAPHAPRLAVLVPPAPAGEPLQLAAMTAPAPEAGRSLLGIPVPKLPYEDKIVAPLVRARDAVRSLF